MNSINSELDSIKKWIEYKNSLNPDNSKTLKNKRKKEIIKELSSLTNHMPNVFIKAVEIVDSKELIKEIFKIWENRITDDKLLSNNRQGNYMRLACYQVFGLYLENKWEFDSQSVIFVKKCLIEEFKENKLDDVKIDIISSLLANLKDSPLIIIEIIDEFINTKSNKYLDRFFRLTPFVNNKELLDKLSSDDSLLKYLINSMNSDRKFSPIDRIEWVKWLFSTLISKTAFGNVKELENDLNFNNNRNSMLLQLLSNSFLWGYDDFSKSKSSKIKTWMQMFSKEWTRLKKSQNLLYSNYTIKELDKAIKSKLPLEILDLCILMNNINWFASIEDEIPNYETLLVDLGLSVVGNSDSDTDVLLDVLINLLSIPNATIRSSVNIVFRKHLAEKLSDEKVVSYILSVIIDDDLVKVGQEDDDEDSEGFEIDSDDDSDEEEEDKNLSFSDAIEAQNDGDDSFGDRDISTLSPEEVKALDSSMGKMMRKLIPKHTHNNNVLVQYKLKVLELLDIWFSTQKDSNVLVQFIIPLISYMEVNSRDSKSFKVLNDKISKILVNNIFKKSSPSDLVINEDGLNNAETLLKIYLDENWSIELKNIVGFALVWLTGGISSKNISKSLLEEWSIGKKRKVPTSWLILFVERLNKKQWNDELFDIDVIFNLIKDSKVRKHDKEELFSLIWKICLFIKGIEDEKILIFAYKLTDIVCDTLKSNIINNSTNVKWVINHILKPFAKFRKITLNLTGSSKIMKKISKSNDEYNKVINELFSISGLKPNQVTKIQQITGIQKKNTLTKTKEKRKKTLDNENGNSKKLKKSNK